MTGRFCEKQFWLAKADTLLYKEPAIATVMEDFFDNWTVQMRKGVLEWAILRSLLRQERYGYELVRCISDVPGLGLTEGTLYPLMSRLRVAGLVSARLEESSEGPARKYYALTDRGREVVSAMDRYVTQLNSGTASLAPNASIK